MCVCVREREREKERERETEREGAGGWPIYSSRSSLHHVHAVYHTLKLN